MTPSATVPDRLSVTVDHPDGGSVRWGADEVDAGLVPGGLSFSTSMPGGFKAANCVLARNLRREGAEGLFHRLTILGPGEQVAWEGRLDQMPRSSQGGGQVSPQAVGQSAQLDDRKDFAMIYMDRAMDRWGQADVDRRAYLIEAGFKPQPASTGYHGTLGAVLNCTFAGYEWKTNATRPHGIMAYDAGPGLTVGRIGAWITRLKAQNTPGASGWTFQAYAGTTPAMRTGDLEYRNDLNNLAENTTFVFAPTRPKRYLDIAAVYASAPAGNAEVPEYGFYLYNVGVIGPHGLPEVTGAGVHPNGASMTGFLASDVLGHALPRVAPGLRFTTGPGGTIAPTDFPIGHLVFADLSSGSDVVHAINAYHQWEWAVWEDSTFYFHPTGARGRTWAMPTGPRLRLDPEGDKSTNIYTGVVVEYTDAQGRSATVGPPGSTVQDTSPLLVDTNPGNPAVAAGVTRVGVLSLTSPATLAGATKIGQVWLLEQSRASRAGSATITYAATEEGGADYPAWSVRAGDRLVVTDRPDDPPRTIIETTYDHASRAVTLTLDNTAARVDALMERIGAGLVGVL